MFFFNSNGGHSGDRTPFDEEDWDDHVDPLEDDGRPGTNFIKPYICELLFRTSSFISNFCKMVLFEYVKII